MVLQEKLLSPEECNVVIKRYLQSNDFKVIAYEEKQISASYGESASEYFLVSIKITFNNAQSAVRFLVKKVGNCSKNNLSSEVLSHKFLFDNPNFHSSVTPKYYYSKDDKLIVLEDLSEQGFAPPKTFDIDHIKLTLKTLAKYHAKSIIFEEEQSKKLGTSYKLSEKFPNFRNVEFFQTSWFRPKLEVLNALIDLIPQNEIKHEEFKKSLARMVEGLSEDTKPKNMFRSVLCHGYSWGENFVFQYSNNQIPNECKLIKFEFQHYSPPALDVLQFLYMRTSQEVRKHCLHELLQFYYDYLKNELQARDLNADMLIPLEKDFEVSVHHFLPIIKLQTACFQQIHCLGQKGGQHNTDMKTSSENVTSLIINEFKTQKHFKKIMIQSLMELQDLVTHPGLTIEDCFKIIKNKVGTTNYQLLNYKITPLGEISGYLGDHNKLKIEISINNEKKTLHLFAKCMPTASVPNSVAVDTDAYHKEMFFYQHLVPMIQGFGLDIINDCLVPCYFTRQDDILIFDDFEILNYSTLDCRKPFSFEVMTLVIEKLAKLHASSIILEEKLNEETKNKHSLKDRFPRELKEALQTQEENHQGGRVMQTAIEAVEHELELFPDTDSPITGDELKIKVKKAYEIMYELVKPSTEFRNVICHGDLWISNILVQVLDGKPTDCRFIDFQISRYCPPAQDLLSFIYLTTNRNVRKQHFTQLIESYYSEFAENLKKYGYNVEEIYPYDNFMKSIEYMMPQAVCQTVLYFQLTLITSNILKEHMADEKSWRNIFLGDRRNFITYVAKRDPLFAERASESIKDLREMCVKYF